MKRAALLLAGLLAVSAPQAQELGRLFFTPEERAALDARRRARLPDKPAAAPPAAASPVTRVDGFVRRSDGPSTVWVNGATSGEASPGSDSRVSIPVGERARMRLRPGETLDRGTGEVRDVLGPNGEVRVRPGK